MSDHAFLEKPNYICVVRILFKLQTSAILHEFLEFWRMALAQFL
jgi:hypothetical protein